MKAETQCLLCGCPDYKVVYGSANPSKGHPQSYFISESCLTPPERIVRCAHCGFIFAYPRLEANHILSAYIQMTDENYVQEEKGRRVSARAILNLLERFPLRGKKLLDIGCSVGFLLNEARNCGWEVAGVELSQWAVQYAKKNFDLKLYNTNLEEADIPNDCYDVVIMQDTIEHLLNPKIVLSEIHRILKPGGILYVNTPDIESNSSRLLRAKWWGINQFHIYYFSRKTLTQLLLITGFQPLKYVSHERVFSFGYWMQRFESYNKCIHGLLALISEKFHLKAKLLRINLWDQIGVFARKE